MVFNQINKHKATIYNQPTYVKSSSLKYKKKFCLVKYKNDKFNIKQLKLIAQIRNIRDYENKSKEDLIKALSEPKPERLKPETPKTKQKQTLKSEIPKQTWKPETPKTKPKTKPKTTPKQTLKLEIPKQSLKPETPKTTSETLKPKEPETKIEIKVNSNKLKKLRKDFEELRHKFSNKDEIKGFRQAFYIAKNYKHLFESEIKKKKKLISESEIKKTNKNLKKLKKA